MTHAHSRVAPGATLDGVGDSHALPTYSATALHPDTPVSDAMEIFSTHGGATLRVRDGPEGAVIGRLTEHEVLNYLRRTRNG